MKLNLEECAFIEAILAVRLNEYKQLLNNDKEVLIKSTKHLLEYNIQFTEKLLYKLNPYWMKRVIVEPETGTCAVNPSVAASGDSMCLSAMLPRLKPSAIPEGDRVCFSKSRL